MARSGSSLPFDHLQWSGASRQLYRARWGRTLPRGPSLNSPMPIRCLRGVAAFSSFPKGLVSISIFRTSAFPKRSIQLQHCCSSCHGFNLFVPGHLRACSRPQDNLGCWNGRSNVTVPWLTSFMPNIASPSLCPSIMKSNCLMPFLERACSANAMQRRVIQCHAHHLHSQGSPNPKHQRPSPVTSLTPLSGQCKQEAVLPPSSTRTRHVAVMLRTVSCFSCDRNTQCICHGRMWWRAACGRSFLWVQLVQN